MPAGATAGTSVWQLPAVLHEAGETIRETAERAAAVTLPDGLKVPKLPSSSELCGSLRTCFDDAVKAAHRRGHK